jgi:hypothetical protein
METLLEQLEAQLEKSRQILAASEVDLPKFQEWLARRELVFIELKELNSRCPAEKRALVARLIEDILAVDARILARLEKQLGDLGERITAAGKVGRAIGGNPYSHPAELVSRSA